jgi:predicted O-methyltransferase YrrM
MHYQTELVEDLKYDYSLPNTIMLKWFNDSYSTSKHLLTIYSAAKSLGKGNILEIGFGRSSFVLAKAAIENNLNFITCDNRDFSYLFNDAEKNVTTYHHGFADTLWPTINDDSIDFAFLDYFSGEDLTSEFVDKELNNCILKMKGNSAIYIHDVFDKRYVVGTSLEKLSKKWKNKKRFMFSIIPFNYGLGIIYIKDYAKKHSLVDTCLKKSE